jgi:hypothetical protein
MSFDKKGRIEARHRVCVFPATFKFRIDYIDQHPFLSFIIMSHACARHVQYKRNEFSQNNCYRNAVYLLEIEANVFNCSPPRTHKR